MNLASTAALVADAGEPAAHSNASKAGVGTLSLMVEVFLEQPDPDTYPNLAVLATEFASGSAGEDVDEFAVGLDLVLDDLERPLA